MKQMTKEELIEYFMELLNESNLLENIMTNEQIREKLNYLINDVTYNPEIGSACASWTLNRDGKGIVNFDQSKIFGNNEKENIVHELLHVLSTSTIVLEDNDLITRTKEKCGLCIKEIDYFYHGGKMGSAYNTAINEGLTDFLAEQISGVKHNGYNTEKDICIVISVIIGQETMLRKAFTENVSINQELLELFKDDIIDKYGEKLGAELNEEAKKIFALSDELINLDINDNIYGLSENGRRIQTKTKEEIYDTLYLMIQNVIENEPDIMKKIDIMIALEKICDFRNTNLKEIRKMVSINALYELLKDDSINYMQKLDIIKKIKEQKINFLGETIDEVFARIEGTTKLSIEEKTEVYMQLKEGYRLTTNSFNIIYDMYVKSGKIVEENFSKKEFLKLALGVSDFGIDMSVISAEERFSERVNECFYHKVGDYYAVSEKNNQKNTFLFDLDGKCLETRKLNFNVNSQTTDHYSDNKLLSRKFGEDRIETIYEQLKEKFEGYKSKSNGEYYNSSVTVIGNILRINYEYYIEKDEDEIDMCYVDFYSVNDDGTLELIPKR